MNAKNLLFFILFCLITACVDKDSETVDKQLSKEQEKIIDIYLKKGAWKHHYLTKEFSSWVDKGLEQDSTIAYLWQQKTLPLWKQHKYDLAIKYYKKAVELDSEIWLSRLGYLKCIFSKQYQSALVDLDKYISLYGSTYEQDHSLEFYKALCYLQLNNYKKALGLLQNEVLKQEREHGKDWVHYLDRFYLAIAFYELEDYQNAILEFDWVLKEYPNFSDAQYYKAICFDRLGKKNTTKQLLHEGRLNFQKGNTFNEDASKYVVYPYQVTWEWDIVERSIIN